MTAQIQFEPSADAVPIAVLGSVWRWIAVAVAVAVGAVALGYLLSMQSIRTEVVAPAVGASSPAPAPASARAASGARVPSLDETQASVEALAPSSRRADREAPAWPLWEFRLQDPLPAREDPLTPVSWRVLGAALFDGRWHAIVQRQGATAPEYYKTGDKLPGGYVIQNITQEDMTLRAGRREIVLAYIGSR